MPRDFDLPPKQPTGPLWDFSRLDEATRQRIEQQIVNPSKLHWAELGELNAVLGRITTNRAQRAAYSTYLLAFKLWK